MRLPGSPRSFIRSALIFSGSAALVLGAACGLAIWMVPRQELVEALPHILPPSTGKVAQQFLQPESSIKRVKVTNPIAAKIVATAHSEEGDIYDASYRQISYPGGDVPAHKGACTDVVVRALRGAGYDLQKLIHEDMKRNFSRYPDPWKLGRTDTNIDHRRVPNHMTFFRRHGQELPMGTTGKELASWQPGDIVVWKFSNGMWHTGVISDGQNAQGLPLVIHNGWVCVEQDCLKTWPIYGHFRFPPHKF